jgi:hypothetical protein
LLGSVPPSLPVLAERRKKTERNQDIDFIDENLNLSNLSDVLKSRGTFREAGAKR